MGQFLKAPFLTGFPDKENARSKMVLSLRRSQIERVVLIYFWGELLFFANVLENTLWIKLVGTMIERPLCSSHQANQSSLKPPGVGDFEDPGM